MSNDLISIRQDQVNAVLDCLKDETDSPREAIGLLLVCLWHIDKSARIEGKTFETSLAEFVTCLRNLNRTQGQELVQ